MSTTAQEQTAPAVQDQQPAAPAPVAPASGAPVSEGPWASEINARFTDPVVRAQVDDFLRTRTQPYITNLEQQNATARDAMSLWNDFSNDPNGTFAAVATELYGDKAQKALDALQTELQQAETPEEVAQVTSELDPRLAAMVEHFENQQNQQAYDGLMNSTLAKHPDLSADLLHPFVAASGGDFHRAVVMYRDMAQRMGVQPQQPEAPQAPPVLGSDTGTSAPSSVPVEPRKQSLWEAVDDFMAEQRRGDPPPVL